MVQGMGEEAGTITGHSEREMVYEYVVGRAISAFRAGDDDQAHALNNMADSIESMSDDEYAANYPEPVGDIS